ncbi:MAG: thiamine ABC transporter ATP-binding protein [Pseudomonadota bacterium]
MTEPQFGLELDKVTFSYGGDEEFAFDTKIKRGDLIAVMGASGSGKSTFFSLVSGFELPRSGAIRIDGTDVTSTDVSKRPITMVFQENNLFSHLTVQQNIGLGIAPNLSLTNEHEAKIEQAAIRTDITEYLLRLPAELSGGQRQRVALARALVRERPLLLLDEAFASLGPGLRNEMLDLTRELHLEREQTTLMITHFPDEAARIADKILFVYKGKVATLAPTAELLSGANKHTPFGKYLRTQTLRRNNGADSA